VAAQVKVLLPTAALYLMHVAQLASLLMGSIGLTVSVACAILLGREFGTYWILLASSLFLTALPLRTYWRMRGDIGHTFLAIAAVPVVSTVLLPWLVVAGSVIRWVIVGAASAIILGLLMRAVRLKASSTRL
jgi:hypothetical protein